MLKLNPDPQFKADVKITVPGQSDPGTLPITFKYRGRKEYGEWLESLREEKNDKGEVTKEGKGLAEAFLDIAVSWGIEEKLNKENVEIFLNNYPAAYHEIFTEYSKSLLVSRIKN